MPIIIISNVVFVLVVVIAVFYFKKSKNIRAVIHQFLISPKKWIKFPAQVRNRGSLKGRLLPDGKRKESRQKPLELLTEGPLAALFKSSHSIQTEAVNKGHPQAGGKKTSAGGDAYDWKQFIETGELPQLNEIQKHELYQAFHSLRYKIKEFLDAHYEDLARMGWEDVYAAVLKNYIEMKLAHLDKMNPTNLSEDDIAFLERLLILRGEESKLKRVKQNTPAPRNELQNRLGVWGDKAEQIYRQYQTFSKRFGFHPRPKPPGPSLPA